MNKVKLPELITEEEADILQEVMNIGFGRAAADLAEYIDIYVILSIPFVQLLPAAGLSDYLNIELKDYGKISIVEQKFWGKFKGAAFLVFPAGAGKKLVSLLDGSNDAFESDPIYELEKETFQEIGNVLIGACVGKITELLGDIVTYSPPRVIIETGHQDTLLPDLFARDNLAIVLRTLFEFNECDVSGYLFIITSQESFTWIKSALHKFMEQYE